MKKTVLALALVGSLSLNAAVLATVDGVEITDQDLAPLLGNNKAELDKLPDNIKKSLVDKVIERQLIIAQTKKEKINESKEYQKALEDMKENLLVSVWMKKQFDSIKISDSEAKKFYDKNKEQFVTPEQVRAKHILVAQQSEAEEILKELKNLKGEALEKKFAEIASSKSIDQGSAVNGGELGWFGKTQMVPEFGDAAFKLKKGQISGVVKSNFGYHIIYKQDAKAKSTVPFDQVKESITHRLKEEKLSSSVSKTLDSLKSKAKIEYK